MYLTGCRPADTFDASKWLVTSDNSVVLTPTKRNNNRTFTSQEIIDTVIEFKEKFNEIRPSLNYARYYNASKNYVPFNLKNYTKKWVVTYLFRYSYCYRFLQNGGTVQQLESDLGHKNLASTLNYYLNII